MAYNQGPMGIILATDLDGTLLYPRRRLSLLTKQNRAFLKELVARGDEVVLASGRNPKLLGELEREIGGELTLIGCNGAYVLTPSGLVIDKPLPRDVALGIYAQLRNRYGISLWFLFDATTTDYAVMHGVSAFFKVAARIYNSLFAFKLREDAVLGERKFQARLAQGAVYKIMPVFGIGRRGQRNAAEAFVALRDRYADRVVMALSSSTIEITAKGVSKGQALLDYAASRDVAPEDVYVVGDSGNDISMFDAFPHSFAMANADEWVKKHAAHVVTRVSDIRVYLANPDMLSRDLETFAARRAFPKEPPSL